MNSTASADNGERRAYSRVEPKASSVTTCSFCWFVLSVYPALKGMTARDTGTFRDHLTTAHGLKQDISP
jgi:hypothetical protein